jgi:hypothetical protein
MIDKAFIRTPCCPHSCRRKRLHIQATRDGCVVVAFLHTFASIVHSVEFDAALPTNFAVDLDPWENILFSILVTAPALLCEERPERRPLILALKDTTCERKGQT